MRLEHCIRRWFGLVGHYVRRAQERDGEVVAEIEPIKGRLPRYGCCGRRVRRTKGHAKPRRWRDLMMRKVPLVLVYTARRVVCPTCGVRVERVPWADRWSRVTKSLTRAVAKLARRTDLGTVASESKVAADLLRERGRRVGVASLRLFRPFPTETVRRLAAAFDKIMIIDRALSYGYEGPLACDTKAALYGLADPAALTCFVAGLGGREATAEMIADAAEGVLSGRIEAPRRPQEMPWINLHPAHSTLVQIAETGVSSG